MDDVCAWCGKKAAGYAFIDQSRYCHDDERSCYQQAQWAGLRATIEKMKKSLESTDG